MKELRRTKRLHRARTGFQTARARGGELGTEPDNEPELDGTAEIGQIVGRYGSCETLILMYSRAHMLMFATPTVLATGTFLGLVGFEFRICLGSELPTERSLWNWD